ncbi:hypothetical protein D3C84_353630 [compost metagenome]
MTILFVAGLTALGCKIELVPPLQLGLGRQRVLARSLIADQIAADGDQRLDPLRPKCGNDVRRARAPVVATQHRFLDLQCIHEVDDITGQRRRLAVANSLVGQEMRVTVAPCVWDQYPVTLGRQQRRHFAVAVNVVRPAVQKNHHRPIGGADFGVRHTQQPGIDMLERAERVRLEGRSTRHHGLGSRGLRTGNPESTELHQREREDRGAKETATTRGGSTAQHIDLHGDIPASH